MTESPLRVLLVDDHEIVRGGLRALLESHPGVTVVAEAAGVQSAIEAASRHRPDLVIMDVRLKDGTGVTATRSIRGRFPETKVLMLTSFLDEEVVLDAMEAGASGYILKDSPASDLLRAVDAVVAGQVPIDAGVTAGLLARARRDRQAERDPRLALLTAQESRILGLISEGYTNRRIGEALALGEKTVTNYASVIFSKLQVSGRSEASTYLARHSPPAGSHSPAH